MGIIRTIKGIKATKKAVNVAKDEIGKEIVKAEGRKEAKISNNARVLCDYANDNMEQYIAAIEALLEETTGLVDKMHTMNDNGTKDTNKKNYSMYKKKATSNLKYLYLAKEYMCLIDKADSGVSLTPTQSKFMTKFSPFFDGRNVLDDEAEHEEENSIWGGLKKAFVPMKKEKEFSFDDFLETYSDRIKDLIIPDFTLIFKKYKEEEIVVVETKEAVVEETKEAVVEETKEEEKSPVEEDVIICSNCSSKAPVGSKFCPSCGAAFNQPRFCKKCGAKLLAGAKFCVSCGTKIE